MCKSGFNIEYTFFIDFCLVRSSKLGSFTFDVSNILHFIRKKPQRACPVCRNLIERNFARHVKSCAERAAVSVCKICMTVVDADALETHQLLCGQKVYTCETCESIFTCSKALRNHQARDHRDNQPDGMFV